MHCVDSISDSLKEMDTLAIKLISSPEVDKARQLHEYIESSMEAADTIRSCTAHQKVCRHTILSVNSSLTA